MKKAFSLKFHLPSSIFHLLYCGALVLFIYMPFHIFLSQWLSTATGGLEVWKLWKDFFTILVTILCVVTVYAFKKWNRLYLLLLGLTVLYALIHLILLFATDQPAGTGLLASAYNLRIFAYVIIGYSLALLLTAQSSKLKTQNLLKRFMKILIVCSTIVCVIALLQWVLPKDLMTHFGYSLERGVKPNFFIDDKPDLPRVFSTLRDPNSLGAFLVLPIVILAQSLIRFWATNKRLLLSGLLILHVLVLFWTFSRSTLLATLLAVFALLMLQYSAVLKKHSKKFLIAATLAVLIIGAGFVMAKDTYLVQNVVFHADEQTVLADPNELRLQLLQKGVDGVLDEPLGNGPGTAGLVSTRLPDGLLTENYFLQIAFEVGFIGFAIFIAILYFIIKNLWLQRKKPFITAFLASFAGLVFANLLFHTWANEAVAISWFLLAGLALKEVKSQSG